MPPRPKPRLFLDANVLFSALHSSRGAPAAIVDSFVEGHVTVVISQQVLQETTRAIKVKYPPALPALHRLLLNTPPEIVKDPGPEEVAPWVEVGREDAPIIAAAIAAQPDYFVTGDLRLVRNPAIAEKSGLTIVTPAQALERLTRGHGKQP